jgi:hypothetical protein
MEEVKWAAVLLALGGCGRVAFDHHDDPATELSASLTPDGLELFFLRAGFVNEVHHAIRQDTTMPFTTSTNLVALTSGSTWTSHVSIAPNGLDLYLMADRPGGLGKTDVWVAHRPSRREPFGAVEHVPELSSPNDDSVDSLSTDGATAFLSYDADTGGISDIWVATRGCE